MKNKTLTIKFDIYNLIAVFGVIALSYAFWSVRNLILIFLIALVLSTFIEDFVMGWKKYHIPRVLSVLIFYLIMFALFFGVIFFLVPIIIKEVGNLSRLYPEIAPYIKLDYFSQQFNNISNFSDALNTIKHTSFNKLFSSFGYFFGGIINLVIVFVVSFYLSVQKHGIDRLLRIFTPKEYEPSVIKVWHNTQKKIGGWFRGQLIIAFLLFLITYIGLSIMGIPYALLLSLLAGLFGLVPYGILIAILPTLAIAFIYGGLRMVLLVAIFYALVQQFLDYIIQPLIFKRMVGIPPILVILSVIIGTQLFGIAGLIIAIPLALFGLEIIAEIEKHKEINNGNSVDMEKK